MAEALGMVQTCRKGQLWGWLWPVGSKLVFDQSRKLWMALCT
jgi:hypothetical protein